MTDVVNVTPAIRFLVRNRLFNAALVAGLALRVVTMLGFPPAIWFAGDSITYVNTAITHKPSISRESGYSLMLMALQPFHSFAVVTAVQHAMGLAIGVMTYALLRRHRLPRWGATLAALPVLLDAYQVQLEHEMLPDIPFAFLVMAAVTLLAWWRESERPVWATATAAALIALAALCWPVGLPLLALLVVVLIVRRAGWRKVAAAVVAGAVPLLLYLAWFDQGHDRVGFNTSSGVFLWSRTMTFANCAVIKPPPDERPLCPDQPVSERKTASLWIWGKHSKLLAMGGRFNVRTNALAGQFARQAIEHQPLDYARAVLDGFALTFTWNRPPHPTEQMSQRYQFSLATRNWDRQQGTRATAIVLVQREYTGGHLAFTHAIRPFAGFLIGYQRVFYVRGTMVGVLLLLGLGGVVRSWRADRDRPRRERGGPALIPWLTGLAVLLVPVMTADFSLRYVVPALPAVTLAAGFAFLRTAPSEAPAASTTGTTGVTGADQQISTGPVPAGI